MSDVVAGKKGMIYVLYVGMVGIAIDGLQPLAGTVVGGAAGIETAAAATAEAASSTKVGV